MRLKWLIFPILSFTVIESNERRATALNAVDVGDTCLAAAYEAAESSGVPVKVLLALTLTETGRAVDGKLQAWPWALNEGGNGLWFETGAEALDYLYAAVTSGTTNIDIGCFQLNYHWHGPNFPSLQAMMDPAANADYAARLVARHFDETGDWLVAAGAFHSKTPDVAERYLARFAPILESLGDPEAELRLASAPAPGFNAYPLLKRGKSGLGGSIVPMSDNAKPLFGNP